MFKYFDKLPVEDLEEVTVISDKRSSSLHGLNECLVEVVPLLFEALDSLEDGGYPMIMLVFNLGAVVAVQRLALVVGAGGFVAEVNNFVSAA